MATLTRQRPNLQSVSLRRRIQIAFVLFTIIVVVGGGTAAYVIQRNTLLDENLDKLTALRDTRANELVRWFEDRRVDIEVFSDSPFIIQATLDFQNAIYGGVSDEGEEISPISFDRLRDLYLGDGTLVDAGDGSLYSQTHANYYPVLRDYLVTSGYYDLFLVDNAGNIIFTVVKEDDYATNLVTGPYATTNIATAFEHSNKATNSDFNVLVDFEFYEPSQEPAMFISSPIFDRDQRIGTLIFQIPIDILNEIMNRRAGLGESGETYLVGSDALFRNDSRFLDQLGVTSTILNPNFIVNTEGTRAAFDGNENTAIIDDYRGVPVLSSWTSLNLQAENVGLDVEPITWALMSEIDEAEATQSLNTLLLIIVLTGAIGIPIAVLIAYYLTLPLNQLAEVAQFVNANDLSRRAPVNSNDEIGQLAQALNNVLDRVANRQRDVQAIVDVSARAATVLDERRLLEDVSDLTKERFNLYHAHIYRLNDNGDVLQLRAGAGYVGRQMVLEGRFIELMQPDSIVATAARSRSTVISNDVRSAPNFLPHPLLPETRSELAVPLIARGEVLGVLDIQSDQVDYFDENVQVIIETLAVQISSAISNVHLLELAERRSRHAQAIATIQQSMQSAGSIDDMLETTAREIAKALRVPQTSIALGFSKNEDKTNNQVTLEEGVTVND